jgi:hypothetical protein
MHHKTKVEWSMMKDLGNIAIFQQRYQILRPHVSIKADNHNAETFSEQLARAHLGALPV